MASFKPIDKFLVRAGDDELKRETNLTQPANQILNFRRFFLERIERRLRACYGAFKHDVQLAKRCRFEFAIAIFPGKGSGDNRITADLATPIAKTHPEVLRNMR